MTSTLRTARTCTAATVICFGTSAYGATVTLWLALPGLWVGVIAWWCASNAYDNHRHTPTEPGPCCSYWRHSNGKVHGPDCRRPPLPRRDTYRLDDADRRAFEETTAHHNDRSAS
jgi:hypothetical protein